MNVLGEFSNLKGVNMCILHVPDVRLFLFCVGMINNNTWYIKWTNLVFSFAKLALTRATILTTGKIFGVVASIISFYVCD